ncbi:unnamed protein product [Boreogadus saida]
MNCDMEEKGIVDRDCLPQEPHCLLPCCREAPSPRRCLLPASEMVVPQQRGSGGGQSRATIPFFSMSWFILLQIDVEVEEPEMSENPPHVFEIHNIYMNHDMEEKGIVARDCLPPEPCCCEAPPARGTIAAGHHRHAACFRGGDASSADTGVTTGVDYSTYCIWIRPGPSGDILSMFTGSNLIPIVFECCGIPPLKPRPERARGTVKDGVYHPHLPAGDGEHLDLPPNQRDGGHLATGRRKARSHYKRGYKTEARERQRHALTAEA